MWGLIQRNIQVVSLLKYDPTFSFDIFRTEFEPFPTSLVDFARNVSKKKYSLYIYFNWGPERREQRVVTQCNKMESLPNIRVAPRSAIDPQPSPAPSSASSYLYCQGKSNFILSILQGELENSVWWSSSYLLFMKWLHCSELVPAVVVSGLHNHRLGLGLVRGDLAEIKSPV